MGCRLRSGNLERGRRAGSAWYPLRQNAVVIGRGGKIWSKRQRRAGKCFIGQPAGRRRLRPRLPSPAVQLLSDFAAADSHHTALHLFLCHPAAQFGRAERGSHFSAARLYRVGHTHRRARGRRHADDASGPGEIRRRRSRRHARSLRTGIGRIGGHRFPPDHRRRQPRPSSEHPRSFRYAARAGIGSGDRSALQSTAPLVSGVFPSEVGRGWVFTVYLPVTRPTERSICWASGRMPSG